MGKSINDAKKGQLTFIVINVHPCALLLQQSQIYLVLPNSRSADLTSEQS